MRGASYPYLTSSVARGRWAFFNGPRRRHVIVHVYNVMTLIPKLTINNQSPASYSLGPP
jgi:hypothetical protein